MSDITYMCPHLKFTFHDILSSFDGYYKCKYMDEYSEVDVRGHYVVCPKCKHSDLMVNKVPVCVRLKEVKLAEEKSFGDKLRSVYNEETKYTELIDSFINTIKQDIENAVENDVNIVIYNSRTNLPPFLSDKQYKTFPVENALKEKIESLGLYSNYEKWNHIDGYVFYVLAISIFEEAVKPENYKYLLIK